MDILTVFALPALVGIGIGVLSGLLGIGGGTIMVPVFRLAFGMSPVMSTATSLFAIIPTSISGAVSHIRQKTCIVPLGLAAGLGGACTSPVGVWLATLSPGWLVMLAAALIIGYSAVNMLRKAWKMPKQADAAASRSARSSRDAEGGASAGGLQQADGEFRLSRRQLGIGLAIGLGAGLASGYVGVGGGFIMVPLMVSLIGIAMRQASGTSLVAVTILALPGTIEQAILGNIGYLAGIAVVVGSIPGAFVGAKLVKRVPERLLRFLFGGFLVVAAVVLVLNEFGILG